MCTMPLTDKNGKVIVRQTAQQSASQIPSQLKKPAPKGK